MTAADRVRLVKQGAKNRGGFLTQGELAVLVEEARLTMVLVRCGGCRFICAAPDVAHLVGIIERDGLDYIRDISLSSLEGQR